MNKIKLAALLLINSFLISAQNPNIEKIKKTERDFNFIISTDLGRNGYYDQKPIANLMGEVAENMDIEFVVASGDVFHYEGVQSVTDPLWMSNYESVYTHPELQIDWYPLLGNHEYRGNTQAVIDYSNISRRWCMVDRYYTQVHKINKKDKLRLIYIDTVPLIDKYRKESDKYPDAAKQSIEKQLAWLEETLKSAKEKWVVVIGHHPIYAETPKDGNERADMQKRVAPLLKKYNVDMYICGHIHNFQHVKQQDTNIDFVVNSSASQSRPVKPIEGTQFCSPESGFSIFSASSDDLQMHMINNKGEIIYTVKHQK